MRIKATTLRDHAFYNAKNPYVRMNGVQQKRPDRYICPKCFNLTLTDTRATDPTRRYQTCVICSWHGPKSSTLTFKEFLQQQTIKIDGQLYLR